MNAEVWKDVPGYPGYVVSDRGRVVSLKPGKEGLKITRLDDHGYVRVQVSVNGKSRGPRVHQLVALAFLGPKPEGMEVRHLDGDKTHNTPENLAYGTSSENQKDKVVHGTHNMARKTHCPYGHEYTPENTMRVPLATGSIVRRCRACDRRRAAANRARAKEVANV